MGIVVRGANDRDLCDKDLSTAKANTMFDAYRGVGLLQHMQFSKIYQNLG